MTSLKLIIRAVMAERSLWDKFAVVRSNCGASDPYMFASVFRSLFILKVVSRIWISPPQHYG